MNQLSLYLLNQCKTLKTVDHIHACLLKTGLFSDPYIFGKLLHHCSVTISDSLDYATRLFLHYPNPNVFMYNTLIRGFSESPRPQNSITTFIEMRRESSLFSSVAPDSFTFAFLLKAAANYGSLMTGMQLHCQALLHGLDGHLFVGTTLISMYGECGRVDFSMKVFDEMLEPNVVAWNAAVTACFRGGHLESSERLFESMPFKDSTSWNLMLAGYAKAGEMEMVRKVFSEMEVKDDVSWSSMITALTQNGCFDEVFSVFMDLQRLGLRPNEVSLTGVLSACAQAGAFEFGRVVHGFVEKSGFRWIISVNNTLIDMYSKCGNVAMARLVLETMPAMKNIVSWTSMIAGLAMHGHGEEAILLLHEMEESGIKPDRITFVPVLYACSHAGLIEQGHECFSKMKNVYNIEPSIEHYGCMVDLYGRAGDLRKAYEFICQMPVPPNDIIWRTLLGACSIHGNVELAEQVKERLSELCLTDSGDYVLLSNVYAVAGKWNNVETVRRSMINQRIKKTPGWSMIEVDKIMYSFVAGEKQNNITKEAYDKLREIMLKLKVEGGYVPEVVGSVLHDVEDEEKEDLVTKHSEKLAVAFGMARLCKGSVIRIVKNLRICRDCHTVMKLISKVYQSEIVVRDRSRFHSFKDGSCSCRDYW
ncbi:hypothetical protein Dsin_001505 [Dipteronia sinensis]|uniref:DYW domain-containing protein n=1 Tax=Dipteronia sinensis TaxID=43782 RepID=A0AAE0B5R3_9ROSI|nr:hypothetical protein Dsin_001505 [Dipteronia sinensis]